MPATSSIVPVLQSIWSKEILFQATTPLTFSQARVVSQNYTARYLHERPEFPWDGSPMWYDLRGCTRTPVLVEEKDREVDGDYHPNPALPVPPGTRANCWSSRVARTVDDFHLPMLDVDNMPQQMQKHLWTLFDNVFQGAPQHWVRSTNNWHVYIGAGPGESYDRAIPWHVYEMVLSYLGMLDSIDYGWVANSLADGECVLRQPGVTKPPLHFYCMWCGLELPSEALTEEHEDRCGG